MRYKTEESRGSSISESPRFHDGNSRSCRGPNGENSCASLSLSVLWTRTSASTGVRRQSISGRWTSFRRRSLGGRSSSTSLPMSRCITRSAGFLPRLRSAETRNGSSSGSATVVGGSSPPCEEEKDLTGRDGFSPGIVPLSSRGGNPLIRRKVDLDSFGRQSCVIRIRFLFGGGFATLSRGSVCTALRDRPAITSKGFGAACLHSGSSQLLQDAWSARLARSQCRSKPSARRGSHQSGPRPGLR